MSDPDRPTWLTERDLPDDGVPPGDRMAAGGMRDSDVDDIGDLAVENTRLLSELNAAIAEVERLRSGLRVVEDKLQGWLDAPPAQMSYAGRLVPINSTGMREVVDEATQYRLALIALMAACAFLLPDAYQLVKPQMEQALRLVEPESRR